MQSSKSPLSPRKKLKNPLQDITLNPKTSITCSNVPENLFDPPTVKKHFSKFGRVLKIRLFSKRRMCIIEYEHPSSAERALLNAGAFDGFMFDVTRSKSRVRRRSNVKEDDPDWVPDSDVEEELSAMGSTPTYRVTRQNMQNVPSPSTAVVEQPRAKVLQRTIKQSSPIKKKLPVREKPIVVQTVSNILEPPMAVTTTQTTLNTSEAAAELFPLRSKISLTPDEKWRVLDARDRILRAWGGAGSRIKVGGATIGTCQDMCPEKELLQRQAEHQVMTLETVLDSDGELEPWRAVKQYSRSSADQEIPMCYELRPTQALMRTTAYLLHEIADTKRQVSMADWFHFMWDRLRGIRKDITQQALCCQDSICLVEMCARFHAHCAARLADLEHTQFDQKLNTDNLTKCLQTLKHMYADVSALHKPREAEFRGYIALLNLGDANFWWEIQQLSEVIQKSEPIVFAIKVFNAIDNNNYVRFFRLVKNEATYLQACILLRYFNDVRARGLARIVKAYAPRGGSRYPADDMKRILAFESTENLKSFISHYGLRFGRTEDSELSVILDRNQFIEDSDPYPIARAINLIESKRNCTVGEIIAGGTLPDKLYKQHNLYTSFTQDGKLKESALVAEEQDYNTTNDSNKDVKALKAEILRLSQGTKYPAETIEPKANVLVKIDPKSSNQKPASSFLVQANAQNDTNLFSFKPAIPVASSDIISNSSDKTLSSDKNLFSFSKPQETMSSENIFGLSESKFQTTTRNIFSKPNDISVDKSDTSQHIFGSTNYKDNVFTEKSNEKNIFKQAIENKPTNLFRSPSINIFSASENKTQHGLLGSKNVFATKTDQVAENKTIFGGKNLFAKEEKATENDTSLGAKNIFAAAKGSLFEKSKSMATFEQRSNVFTKPVETNNPSNIFGSFGKPSDNTNKFTKSDSNTVPTIFSNGKTTDVVSPGSLFKSVVNGSDIKSYSIFQSKNKAQTVADNILNSVTTTHASTVYEFNQNDNENQNDLDIQRQQKIREEERKLQERKQREEELRKQELRQQEEEKHKEEERKKKEELKLLEQKRRIEEHRKQEELKMKLEMEKKKIEQEKKAAELKRKADEERKFRERVDKESSDILEEIINEINIATVKDIMREEAAKFNDLVQFAESVTDNIISDLCNTICENEIKAEQFLSQKIMKKWFRIWREEYIKNTKRRNVLNDTPVWLTQYTPVEEATLLRRIVENDALKNMNAIHRGYKFTGELKSFPTPEPYDIMEIIRSPLLKRMKQIKYPYDKCFFWKITIVSPGSRKWMYQKVNVEKWLLDVFSDKNKHDISNNLKRVEKQSWNRLMDFAISISFTSKENGSDVNEAVNGSNGLIFYAVDLDIDLLDVINNTLKHKYPYQVVPIAVIIPVIKNNVFQTRLEVLLNNLVQNKIIAAYRIFVISSNTVLESLNMTTKTAMKWLAKKYPRIPPLEIDYLKSICQRYLGNEIWCRLRSNKDGTMNVIAKDLYKLVKCYNTAVEKLTKVITNEDLFNYSSFPLEFNQYLDRSSPYPKPFEFIPSSVKSSDNILAIKRIMAKLQLPDPLCDFNPVNAISMQNQITSYCHQIGCFENPNAVVSKVVAVLPNELSNITMPCEDFRQYYSQYNLLDFMNIIVYEKIKALENFENRFAIYEKPVLEKYREALWLYEINIIKEIKHKAIEYEDEIDFFIEAKRRKVAMDSLELLMLEEKDVTMVEEDIKEKDLSISKYDDCTQAVKQLEQMLEQEKMKSLQFENFLKAALADS